MPLGQRTDPYPAFNFLVEIEGLVLGGFSEVTGLQVEIEVEDYREGGLNSHLHRLAGPTRYPSNLVLRRGVTDGALLWEWQQEVIGGKPARRHGSVALLDSVGEQAARWDFIAAYPVRWTGPELRASSADVAMEALELAHDGLTRV
jgi:phage tail-like protein